MVRREFELAARIRALRPMMLPPIFSSSILQGFLHDGFAVLPSGHVRSWQKGDCWMERRTLIGGLLLSSGIIGVRWPVAARGRRDSEANEEAMWRLRNAHEFFPKADFVRPADLLYQVGIVSQLALPACRVGSGIASFREGVCPSGENMGVDVSFK